MSEHIRPGRSAWLPVRRVRHCAILVSLLLLAAGRAWAQTPSPLQEWQYSSGIVLEKMFEPKMPEWRAIVGVSGSVRPLYDGARPYRATPGPAIDIRYRDLAFASVGSGIGVNVLRGENYRAGIAVTYDLGRRVADYPSHLQGLGNIAPAPVVKLFASYAVSKSFPLVVRADLRRIFGGSDGFVADLGTYMPLPGSSRHFVMFAGPSVTFGGGDYMQNTFGVTPLQSFRSGYPAYRAHAGLKQVGFGFSATWFATAHWLLNAQAAISRLLGSAADSPITERVTQETLALTVAYRF
jgi:outer membrane scaffolding protein for murein synthesis (MipA/OmpV family)